MYSTAEEIQPKIDEYFELCKEENRHMTFSGLAYHLGFAERRSLNDYAAKDSPVSTPVKRAMLRIEQHYEEGLHEKSPTGSIFAMKNRGWVDQKQVDVRANIRQSIDDMDDSELDAEIARYEQNSED